MSGEGRIGYSDALRAGSRSGVREIVRLLREKAHAMASEEKPKKEKKDKAAAAAEAPKAEKPAEAPRPPADPRLKVMKKFEGRFLPKGPLRDRYKAIRQRWDSNDNHGDVTFEELKTLLTDWRASRQKGAKPAKV